MRTLIVLLFSLPLHAVLAQQKGLVPDHAYAQYAGSIGLGSIGIGYDVFGKHRVSVHYGYVPESRGGRLNILASKLVFKLYSIRLSEEATLNPLDAGVMFSYHFGEQFQSRWPQHRYPDGYYWWRTSLRAHLLTQTSVTFALRDKRIRSLTAYVELNTNELYFISLIQNLHSLKPSDIIRVGVGVRASF